MRFFKSLFISLPFYLALGIIAIVYVLGYFFVPFSAISNLLLISFAVLSVVDIALLYGPNSGFSGSRISPQRLSNGDDNLIRISIKSGYRIKINARIIDEVPIQFQIRDFLIQEQFLAYQEHSFSYNLRPVNRGLYSFDDLLVYAATRIGFFSRRFQIRASQDVPVYPSYIQMRKFEMYAISNRLTDLGVKRIRRLGHTMEFDQIKEYVRGDDIRSINWKATARSNQLMVNQYQDERSQQIINVIDLGRVMKMPFDGLQLLEYAINTSLVLSNIAVLKEDKAGLLTFSNNKFTAVPPEKKRTHVRSIQHALYNVETNFMESDYDKLLIGLKQHVKQRSLILLYTNFEALSSMQRQLAYLKRIAKDHLLVTIFFENTEVNELIKRESKTVGDIYLKTIAEKFNFEKRQIVKSLNREGIQTILTPPKELSINAINKYLELKARALI